MPPASARASSPPASVRSPRSERPAAEADEAEPAPASRRGRVCRQAPKDEPSGEAEALTERFEHVFEQITARLRDGDYVAEHCSMLVEIARISAASTCPQTLRERAIEALLKLGRRSESEIPCRRGLRELNDQCTSRGIKQGSDS